jgi:hypothetical protein
MVLADLLDHIEPLPLDTKARAVVSQAWQESSALPGKSRRTIASEAKAQVVRKAEADASQFLRHVSYSTKRAPPVEEKARAGAVKLREFYTQVNIVKQDVDNYGSSGFRVLPA